MDESNCEKVFPWIFLDVCEKEPTHTLTSSGSSTVVSILSKKFASRPVGFELRFVACELTLPSEPATSKRI